MVDALPPDAKNALLLAVRDTLDWDARRHYTLTYEVRDKIHAGLDALKASGSLDALESAVRNLLAWDVRRNYMLTVALRNALTSALSGLGPGAEGHPALDATQGTAQPAADGDVGPGPSAQETFLRRDEVLTVALAEYLMEEVFETELEAEGRRSAVRGMMVRLGLYSAFSRLIAEKEAEIRLRKKKDQVDPAMDIQDFAQATPPADQDLLEAAMMAEVAITAALPLNGSPTSSQAFGLSRARAMLRAVISRREEGMMDV